jgi:acyl CoA:acetate/3-ketoacid CoA transferase beta subunit
VYTAFFFSEQTMLLTADELIINRALRELKGIGKVALGPGFPQRLKPRLSNGTEVLDLQTGGKRARRVDVVVLEALEVSEKGDLALDRNVDVDGLQADTWIVSSPILRGDGEPRCVKECRFPVQISRCVNLIITELGVISVNKVGFELRELSPGAASDQVRLHIRASLHVADDIQRLKLEG